VSAYFPGFVTDSGEKNQNFLLSDSYPFGPNYTNELRLSRGQLDADQVRLSPQAIALAAQTLPRIGISNVAFSRHAQRLALSARQELFDSGDAIQDCRPAHVFAMGWSSFVKLPPKHRTGFLWEDYLQQLAGLFGIS
jgi:hypothetical protein